MNKWLWIGLGVAALVGFLIWLFVASSKPLPGQKQADLGRKHVEVGSRVLGATSDPPTSGNHYADWVRSGVYEEPKDDGNLVHSLEHGYVIMSYNCDKKVTSAKGKVQSRLITYRLSLITSVHAHGIEEEVSQSADKSTSSAVLSDAFRSDDCHKLVDQLIAVYEKKGKIRLIVIPRPNMDVRIALTAWNYLDKFDSFDQARIEKFIDAHLNKGPEKTME